MLDFEGRKVVLKALTGSYNYNLNDETSDKDYKYFVLPTFDDLYYNKMYSKSEQSPTLDYSVHDIRKLPELFWKANLNFLEILYSKKLDIFPSIDPYGDSSNNDLDSLALAGEIFSMREEIVTMNLPYLYNSCKGMYFEKMKRLEQGTQTTQILVDKYGYDTKQALHAYRVLDFCISISQGEFFENALVYDGGKRSFILDIKHGEYTLTAFKDLMEYHKSVFDKVEPWFKEQKPNEETKAKVDLLVKELVRRNIND